MNFIGKSIDLIIKYLFHLAISLLGSTVPTKTGLNWFMPALANNKVGSSIGMVDEE